MQRIVEALVQTIAAYSIKMENPKDKTAVDQTGMALVRKIEGMPTLLRCAMGILIGAFNLYGYLTAGRPFYAQNMGQRLKQFRQWQQSPIGPCRDFTSFFEKMTAFIYFSLRSQ